MTIVWAILAVLFLGAELITTQLVIGYFGLGAIAALVLSATGSTTTVQVAAFTGVSVVLIALTRKPLKGILNRRSPLVATNVAALSGQRAIVTQVIDNDAGTGQVRIGGEVWRARGVGGAAIEPDAVVTVDRIEGVTAWVRAR